jgi:uncharacterized FlgJ-related protein
MSDRIKGLVVTFSEPISSEQAEIYKTAISLMRNVANVEDSVDDYNDKMNRAMIYQRVKDKIYNLMLNDFDC